MIYIVFIKKKIDEPIDGKIILTNYQKVIKMMVPIIPHFANECLEQLNVESDLNWPNVEKEFLEKKANNIVIQINGRKRDLLNLDKDIGEKEILAKVIKSEKCVKYLENKEIKKTFYVKNKLINIIV